ncbi:MFS transporter [Natrinema hispanicum]|uniref:Predicted arabinose efflux permease, MFS family n=1 Tax=Natrinema hispanicum TaxID=392421 RepID=A0A1I0HUF7_9EURY|nr:MFS transporter [Natrinema hispanicum]SET86816.1 Predicted arabinose efflux permease, MFS family [Natrinema hispanicum]
MAAGSDPSGNTDTAENRHSRVGYWGPLIAVSLAMFVVSINSALMNVAVPAIVAEFDTTVTVIQGAISFYSLVLGALILPGGTLPAIYEVRRVMTAALIVYAGGTLLAALSWNVVVLTIGWSLIMGIGAAVLLPLTYTVLMFSYEADNRATALGLLAGVSAVGAAVGPIFGGAVTTYASWRWGFALELVVVGATLVFVRYVSAGRLTDTRRSLDLGGTVLSIAGATALVTGFLLSGKYGWLLARRPFAVGGVQFNPFGTSPAIWFLGLGLLTLAAFVQYERRLERAGRSPLVPMGILMNSRFLSGVATYSVRSVVMAGFMFVVPVYLQSALGHTAFEAGLAMLPYSLATLIFSTVTTSWRASLSPKTLVQAGIACMGLGVILLYGQTSPEQTIRGMAIPMAFVGAGLGLLMGQLVNMTLSAVPTANYAEASGVLNASSSMGFSLGTAVVGSVLLGRFYGSVVDGVLQARNATVSVEERIELVLALEDAAETATEATQQAFLAQLTPAERRLLEGIFETAMVDAQQAALLLLALFVLLLLVVSTFLPRQVPETDESSESLELAQEPTSDTSEAAIED